MINPSPAGAARRFGARPALCGRRWRVIIWVLVRLTQLQAGLLGRLGSTSEDVAKVITQAVTARRPRARYLINPVAKSLAAINQVLPDRLDTRLGTGRAGGTGSRGIGPPAS